MDVRLCLAQSPAADALLSSNPFALLIGMVLDQQIPLEWAFASPQRLVERLGHDLDVGEIAGFDPAALAALFAQPPALHRFPAAMAARVQTLAQLLVRDYDADAAAVWTGARSGAELMRRIEALPGFGRQKAQIFVALLGKQLGVRPRGWREAAGPFGAPRSHKSVADITDERSLGRVRDYKAELKRTARASAAPG